VASIHISVNLFDNPILGIAIKKTATWVGGLAGGGGLLLGLIGGALLFRKRGAESK
jgi:prolipoprotein diacylglyceryltransferase